MAKFDSHKWIREQREGKFNEAKKYEEVEWIAPTKTFDYFGTKMTIKKGEKGLLIRYESDEQYLVDFQDMRFYAMDGHQVKKTSNSVSESITEAETNIAGQTKQFRPGDKWSNDFDYVGMLRYGAEYEIPDPMYITERPTMYALNQLYESFTDVNYHTEAKDLGNAIDWLEDAKGTEDVEKAIDFLEMWKEACAKTLAEITKGK